MKPGRNDPCPCGSRRKYKQCCLPREAASAAARAADPDRRTGAAKPSRADAHMKLGHALRDAGRVAEAVTAYRSVLALRAHDPGAHAALGYALQLQGRPEEAIDAYRRALKRAPDDAGVHNNLGNALLDAGDAPAALACYQRALALRDAPQFRANVAAALSGLDTGTLDARAREMLVRAIAEA